MNKTQYDMVYLAACGVNSVRPEQEYLNGLDIEKLYQLSHGHSLDALVGTVLKQAGVTLPNGWNERISKAIRKVVLFDAERAKLLSSMEQKGIWYLPLKGIVLKDFYPAVGMRQMSDNDILFDYSHCDEVQAYMESQGYEAVSVGVHNHDVYHKEPVYNFELHKALYGEAHQDGWAEYYENVKDRLVVSGGTSFGYRFTDEDFYVYIVSHAYKHYAGSGTGLRTLLDFYVYLSAKEQTLDFAYIEKECKVLGIDTFERQSRELCKKVFAKDALIGEDALKQSLSEEEMEMLLYYLTSGAYGTLERGVENRMKQYRTNGVKCAKLRYVWDRLFPGYDVYRVYAPSVKCRWLQSVVGWFCRAFCVTFQKKRREHIVSEMQVVKRTDKQADKQAG